MSVVFSLALFGAGVALVIWATERLLEGLVGLAWLLRVSAFAVAAILSGFEPENVAVGLAAARRGADEVALGTVLGGAIFLVCVALGLGALLYPLRVRLPHGFLVLMAACPLAVGVGLTGGTTGRLSGAVLLAAFALAIAYLVMASRHHNFLESEEVQEAEEKRRSCLHNGARKEHGLSTFCASEQLMSAATAHSRDMLNRGYYDHVAPDGNTPEQRVRATGYSYSSMAENIHKRSLSYAPNPTQKDLKQVFEDWMASSGHRANLLNPDLREIGIGVAVGRYGTEVETSGLYTVDFGTPQ